MSEPEDRTDDSPATWREVREAVAAVIDFQMKIMQMTVATMKKGREASLSEEGVVLDAAAALERIYKIDELRNDR